MTASGSVRRRTPRQDPLDEEVAVEDQPAPDRAAEQPGEQLGAGVALRPGPGVADDEAGEAVRLSCGDREPDRPAPVLDHHRHAREVQLHDELLDYLRVLGRRESVSRRGGRQPEARVVDCDAPIVAAQPGDDVTIEKRPRRIAVEEQ
jgi:hypothetical protein